MRPRILPDKETLRSLYWDESLRPVEIAARYKVGLRAVISRMNRDGIRFRTKSEAVKLSHAKTGRKKRLTKLSDVLRCRNCCWVWKRDTILQVIPCPRCGALKDCRTRKHRVTRPGSKSALRRLNKTRDYKAQYARLRRSVLLLVGRGTVACVNCGCDRAECLEVNHIAGGGNKEFQNGTNSTRVYWQIVRLQRAVDDLNLLCKVCNALHCLELKFGKLPFEIIYRGSESYTG